MSDPVLDLMKSGKAGANSDPVLSLMKGQGAAAGGDPVLSLMSGKAQPSESLPVLEKQVQDVGAPAPAQDSPGLFRSILDVISRTDYAVAGATEELLSPKGGGLDAVPGRVASELFSGIGDIHGKKKGFGQVLEDAGVSEFGHFSDLAPFLYSETGQGLPLQKGGWADPTGRGAIGLGLDIAADPTTYLGVGIAGKTAKVGDQFLSKTGARLLTSEAENAAADISVRAAAIKQAKILDPMLTSSIANSALGKTLETAAPGLRDLAMARAKERVGAAIAAGATDLVDRGGIKWMGMHVIDNPLESIAKSGVTADLVSKLSTTKAGQMALASTAWTKKNLVDPVATLFVKGWGVRGLEGARGIMDDALDKEAFLKGAANREMEKSPLAAWAKKSTEERDVIFKPVIDAFQEGGMAAVPDEFRPAMQYYANKVNAMFKDEVASGLLTKEQKLQNYFAQYYRNDTDELARVIYKQAGGIGGVKGQVENLIRMGRNAEERDYPTLKDAIEGSTSLNSQNKSIPILRPVYDPVESLRRRWEHSITKRVNREMVTDLEAKFGPMDLKEVYDLAQPVRYGANAAKEKADIQRILLGSERQSYTPASQESKIFQTPELNLANQNLAAAWESLPLKHYETQTLKNLDEVSYFRRRGWDVVEEADNKYVAYRAVDVGVQQYESFSVRLRRARAQVDAATKRATRDVSVPGQLIPGIDKIAAVGELSDDGKRAFFMERFKQIGDREEAANVLKKYDGFREFFPSRLVHGDTDFAADGSVFKTLNAGAYEATLPATLAKEVAGMSDFVVKNDAMRKVLQGYDTVNNFWKGAVTWAFPSFHFRNAYSNVAQSFVDIGIHSLNPQSYYDAGKILFSDEKGFLKTATGSYSYDEVRNLLNRYGINTSAKAKAEFVGAESKLEKIGGPLGWVRDVGTKIENTSRAQLAINYLTRGMEPVEVGARVKKFQLDYANGLTSFERQWMKRVIPFYTFQRLNMGLMLDNIVKRPGLALAEIKPFAGRDSENQQMTSWDAGALKLRLNRDGKNVQMITGIDLPIRNLDLLFRGNIKDTMANAIGMLSPVIKTPIEIAANKSLFTGNDFERANSPTAGRIIEHMPAAVQKWMGYDKTPDAAGRPQYTFDGQRFYLVAQSFVTSRFLSTSDRQWKQYVDTAEPNSLKSLLDFTTGLRFQDMNMDAEMAKKAKERQRDLENALVRWGQRKEFSRYFVPKGQK